MYGRKEISHSQIVMINLDDFQVRNDLKIIHENIEGNEVNKLLSKYHGSVFVVPTKDIDFYAEKFSACGMRFGYDYFDLLSFKYGVLNIRTKKLIVAYGNCQINDYYKCMRRCEDFNAKYECAYFKYLDYPRWKEDRLEYLMRICDVLLHIRDTFDKKFRDCRKFVEINNKECLCIGIPAYSFRGYFPQSNTHIQEKAKYDIIHETFNTFHREDVCLNNLIENGFTLEEIMHRIKDLTFFDESAIINNIKTSLWQLNVMDRLSDISIYDFVKDNYKKHRLFKDPVHFSDILIFYIVKQIMVKLDCIVPDDFGEGTIHKFTEMPIYPCVASCLGLEWCKEEERTALRLNKDIIYVSFDEYITRYCRFVSAAKDIIKSLSS